MIIINNNIYEEIGECFAISLIEFLFFAFTYYITLLTFFFFFLHKFSEHIYVEVLWKENYAIKRDRELYSKRWLQWKK